MNLKDQISKLKKERNAIILAHYYTTPEVQQVADFVGDSLALSQQAASTSADVILFAGVKFMAETAKILSPEKIVLLPDAQAGCSLADSCDADEFQRFIAANADHTVICYVNTTAQVKALTDIVCTSSNAVKIVESLPRDAKIIFGPDRNLGGYIKALTGRENMKIWDGACHVHQRFSLERILQLKAENPGAKILAHPECSRAVVLVADMVGSTAEMLAFSKVDSAQIYIVATESGILYEMQIASPDKRFIAAPSDDLSCACNDCAFMKLNTLAKIEHSLRTLDGQIDLPAELIARAKVPIERMLALSK
ncbi:MAG: quinolinate synthase NadA [Mucinivorans sp.]